MTGIYDGRLCVGGQCYVSFRAGIDRFFDRCPTLWLLTISTLLAARERVTAPNVSARGKLVKVDGVPAGQLFGGGGAIAAELSANGRWMIVVDDRWEPGETGKLAAIVADLSLIHI